MYLLKCIALVHPNLKIQLERIFFAFKTLFKDFLFRILFILYSPFLFPFVCLIIYSAFVLTVCFACYSNLKFGEIEEVDCMRFFQENLFLDFSFYIDMVKRHYNSRQRYFGALQLAYAMYVLVFTLTLWRVLIHVMEFTVDQEKISQIW